MGQVLFGAVVELVPVVLRRGVPPGGRELFVDLLDDLRIGVAVLGVVPVGAPYPVFSHFLNPGVGSRSLFRSGGVGFFEVLKRLELLPRLVPHFLRLRQGVTVLSAGGFGDFAFCVFEPQLLVFESLVDFCEFAGVCLTLNDAQSLHQLLILPLK